MSPRPTAQPSRLVRAFHAVIKPVGSRCNLDCRYCYYLHKKDLLGDATGDRIADDVLEEFIRQYIAQQDVETITDRKTDRKFDLLIGNLISLTGVSICSRDWGSKMARRGRAAMAALPLLATLLAGDAIAGRRGHTPAGITRLEGRCLAPPARTVHGRPVVGVCQKVASNVSMST